jgi:hypothetical protein
MQMQFLGASRFTIADVVSPFTLLEMDLSNIRERSFETMVAKVATAEFVEWIGHKWDAIEYEDIVFALFPVRARVPCPGGFLTSCDVVYESCVVAWFDGTTWLPTPILLLGNIGEAKRELLRLLAT